MRISIIGLGKLGAPMAAVLAHKGFSIVGVDSNPEPVRAIQEGRAPVSEPGLDELIRQNRSRLTATTDCREAVAGSDATFLLVPTPSEPDGTFSLRDVLAAARLVGEALQAKRGFHLVVLASTVMPGATGERLRPALEGASGRQCGIDFGLCYNPEFVALGTVIRDMLAPDLVLIGESDERSGEMLVGLHRRVAESEPAVARMNFVNAEITKLAINTYVTTKISYANMLARICERLPGADVDEVTRAAGLDSRIGRKYLKGALGYGGPCFPRDNLALAGLARREGVEANLAEATDRLNRQQAPRLAELLLANLPEGGTVGILGLAYKPGTSVVDESQGLILARHLLERGVPLVVYDPAAMPGARQELGGGPVRFAASLEECAGEAHVLAITTPWEQFQSLAPEHLNGSKGRPTVIDCWRILPRLRFEPSVHYVALGLGPPEASRESFAVMEK